MPFCREVLRRCCYVRGQPVFIELSRRRRLAARRVHLGQRTRGPVAEVSMGRTLALQEMETACQSIAFVSHSESGDGYASDPYPSTVGSLTRNQVT